MRLSPAIASAALFAASLAHAAGIESLKIPQCAAKPIVVFENSARETYDTWDKVIAAVKPDAGIDAYNRPGYGKCEATDSPRDSRTIVDELRTPIRTR